MVKLVDLKRILVIYTFPNGETSWWRAVILSPSFSFLTWAKDQAKDTKNVIIPTTAYLTFSLTPQWFHACLFQHACICFKASLLRGAGPCSLRERERERERERDREDLNSRLSRGGFLGPSLLESCSRCCAETLEGTQKDSTKILSFHFHKLN
jgi:hypothetical protein